MLAVRIAYSDPDKQSDRRAYFEAHRQHLRSGALRILLSGPFQPNEGGRPGAIVVAEVEQLQELTDFSAADPFVQHGVYAEVQIVAWTVSLSTLGEIAAS